MAKKTVEKPIVKNVLSIDFDYIMFPCINLYNDMVQGNESPSIVWDRIERERDIDSHLSYDAKALEMIALLIKAVMKSNKKIIFCSLEDHGELPEVINIKEDKSLFNIVNIDFHHDVYYHDGDKVNMSYFDECNCANWLAYIHYKKCLNQYCWIKAPNSGLPDLNRYDKDLSEKISIKNMKSIDIMIDKLNNGEFKFDYIVFVLSPQWVPYKYHHLFDLICKMV